jgi:predicted esterase
MRRLIATLLSIAIVPFVWADDITGLQSNATFENYSPLSGAKELTQRIVSPLMLARLHKKLAQSSQDMRDQSIDLAHERFSVYVPPTRPPGGYELLVFVAPWEEARIPQQWFSTLDKHAMIFVTAAKSGNDENVIDRREPLALLATFNVMQKYSIDLSRVYVGGFSGGSRVALRLALAFPDLFRGALLEAGSDPIGDTQIAIPKSDLFRQFQQRTHVVYLTGKNDPEHLDQDTRSMRSLREWCVAHVDDTPMPFAGHETADAVSFNRALTTLENTTSTDQRDSSTCMKRIEDDISAQLHSVETSIVRGDDSSAKKTLEKIDARFGGLAAPRSVELMQTIEAHQ